jgi:excisionase family DNA binding protein
MTIAEFKKWLMDRLAELEPTIKRPANVREAEIVTEAKAHAYNLGIYPLANCLPERETKTPLDACLRLRECLDFFDAPTPSDGTTAMDVETVAKILGVSGESIYRLCRKQLMPHTRVGKRITISPAQLEDYRASANQKPRAKAYRHL